MCVSICLSIHLFSVHILSTQLCMSLQQVKVHWSCIVGGQNISYVSEIFQYDTTIQTLHGMRRNFFLILVDICIVPEHEIRFYPVNITAGISPGNTITHHKYLTQGLGLTSDSTAC